MQCIRPTKVWKECNNSCPWQWKQVFFRIPCFLIENVEVLFDLNICSAVCIVHISSHKYRVSFWFLHSLIFVLRTWNMMGTLTFHCCNISGLLNVLNFGQRLIDCLLELILQSGIVLQSVRACFGHLYQIEWASTSSDVERGTYNYSNKE